jgi:WD40 repeat protein
MEALRSVLFSGAADPLAEALDALPGRGRLLLAVDQLEELFTVCRSTDERITFVETLSRAATDPEGRAVVVAALRADFYGRLAAYPRFAELLGGNHALVGFMQPSELRRAVELPAGRVGLRVEPGLTDALVDDLEGQPGALPLLSTALLELWQERREDTFTLAAYRESGGVHGAVARLAESTYARIPGGRKPLVRPLMLRLVGEGAGDAPVRRRAPLAELELERNEDVAAVLGTLAESRLVTVGEGTVEVAHEALLREWPRLREWIEKDAEGRRLRGHITQAAAEWDAAGRDEGELYRGARLVAALDWSTDHAFELNELEREFVRVSREISERETRRVRHTNRRLRTLLAGAAIFLAAAIVGGILALNQRGEARDAETAQFAQRLGAQALVEDDLDLSLLLARQAVAIDDTLQTRGYLLAALLRAPAAIGIMHGLDEAELSGVALSPDGRTLVVSDFFDKLLFFDAGTHKPRGVPLDVGRWVESLAYSPDGKTLAYGGIGSVTLLDAHTRKPIAHTSIEGHAARLAFTRDGSRLVLQTEAGSIYVRAAATLKPVGPPIRPDGLKSSFIWSYYRPPHFALTPDSHSVVTASDDGELAWWDLRNGRKSRTLRIAKGYHALALSPDGRACAVGVEGGMQLVDVGTGEVRIASTAFADSPNWLRFSPDGRTIVSTGREGTVTLWDAASLALRETLRGHSRDVQQPVFSLDGGTLYTVSSDGAAIAWDLTGTRRIMRPFRFTHDRDFDRSYDLHTGRFSPDGRLIAVGLKEEGIALLNAKTLNETGAPLVETGGEVKALNFSPDGRTLAAVTANGVATIWDLASRAQRREPFAFGGGFLVGVEFTSDGRTLVANGNSGVQLWDAATGASRGQLGETWGGTSDLALGAEGALVAVARGPAGGAEIWDVPTRSLVASVEGRASADDVSVALSADGRTLAVGGYGRVVRLWDVRTQKLRRELDHGGNGAVRLEFSRDGRMLVVSGFGEPVVTLWDVATGMRIGPTLRFGRRTAMSDLSTDGRRLLMTLANGQGAVFDVDPQLWARRACALANRTLTREEWERFLPGRAYEPACAT